MIGRDYHNYVVPNTLASRTLFLDSIDEHGFMEFYRLRSRVWR